MAASLKVDLTVRLRDEFSRGFASLRQGASAAAGAVTGAFRGTLGAVRSLTSAIFNLRTLVAGVIAGQAARSFIAVADSIEKAELQLQTLLGSTDKAAESMARIKRLANEVAIDFDVLVSGAGSLASQAKKSAEELDLWLRIAADIQGAFATLSFDEVASNLSRALSAGAASAELFRERGVSSFLGFQAGVSYSAEETRKRILAVWSDSESGLKGAAQRMNSTWSGILSQLSDRWFDFRRIVFVDSGLGDALKERLGELNDTLQAAFSDPTSMINNFLDSLKLVGGVIIDIISYTLQMKETFATAFSFGEEVSYRFFYALFEAKEGRIARFKASKSAAEEYADLLMREVTRVQNAYEQVKLRFFAEIDALKTSGASGIDGNLGEVGLPDFFAGPPVDVGANAMREALKELNDFRSESEKEAARVREEFRRKDVAGISAWAEEQKTILASLYAQALVSAEEYNFAVAELADETKARIAEATKATSDFAAKIVANLKEKAVGAINSFGEALANTFGSVVSGSQSAGEAFREFVQSAISSLIKLIAQMAIFAAIGAGIGLFFGNPLAGARIGAAAGSGGGFTLDSISQITGGGRGPSVPSVPGPPEPSQTIVTINAVDAPSFKALLATQGADVIRQVTTKNLRTNQDTRRAVRS